MQKTCTFKDIKDEGSTKNKGIEIASDSKRESSSNNIFFLKEKL